MMSPEGSLGEVPDDQVQAAEAKGFRVMTSQALKDMYQSIFMQHSLIKQNEQALMKKFQRRQRTRKAHH